MKPLQVLIVEDSVSYAIELEQTAIEIGYHVINNVDNSADALDIIFSTPPDIILMDIDIKGKLTGLEIAQKIKHLDIPILFITSFNDHDTYQQALETRLVGYIVKPVEKITLASSLRILLQGNLGNNSLIQDPGIKAHIHDKYLFLLKKNVYYKVMINDILFVKSDDNYCSFILADKDNFLLRISLNKIEQLLCQHRFIRCHRQYVINTTKVDAVDVIRYILRINNEEVPFSRSKKKEIMDITRFPE